LSKVEDIVRLITFAACREFHRRFCISFFFWQPVLARAASLHGLEASCANERMRKPLGGHESVSLSLKSSRRWRPQAHDAEQTSLAKRYWLTDKSSLHLLQQHLLHVWYAAGATQPSQRAGSRADVKAADCLPDARKKLDDVQLLSR